MSRLPRGRTLVHRLAARHLSHERPLSTVNEDVQYGEATNTPVLDATEIQGRSSQPRRPQSAPIPGEAHVWQPPPGGTPYYMTSPQVQAFSQEVNVAESIFPSSENGLFIAYTGPCKNPDCYTTNSYRKRFTSSASITISCWACDWPLFRVSHGSGDSSWLGYNVRGRARRSSSPWIPSCFDVPFGASNDDVLHNGFYEEPARLTNTSGIFNPSQIIREGSRSPSLKFRGRFGSIDRAKDFGSNDTTASRASPEATVAAATEATLIEGATPIAGRKGVSPTSLGSKLRAILKRIRNKVRGGEPAKLTQMEEKSDSKAASDRLQKRYQSTETVGRSSQDIASSAGLGRDDGGPTHSTPCRSIRFEPQTAMRQHVQCRCTANCPCMQQMRGSDRATSGGTATRSSSLPSSTTRPPSSGSRLSPTTALFGIGAGMTVTGNHSRRDSLLEESVGTG